MSMPTLHLEIICFILRLATYVHEACDTSFEVIEEENRDTAISVIQDSMLVKTTLSLVSRSFHLLMEQFLYETIIIFKFKFVPILLKRLRSIPAGYSRPRGHTCRRLDFYLGVLREIGYLDEAWYEGGHTFWGLLPACPHLEVLVARIIYKDPLNTGNIQTVPHLTHNALWKTISSCCSRTLRRLELYGFSIRMDRIEMMLRPMHLLEVCEISHCVLFHRTGWWYYPGHRDIYDSYREADTYDDKEPRSRRIGVNTYTYVIHQAVNEGRRKSGWFNSCDHAEFVKAKFRAAWLPWESEGGPTPYYVLPKLHTLCLSWLDMLRLFEFFLLPSLKSLATSHDASEVEIEIDGKNAQYDPSRPFPPSPSTTHLSSPHRPFSLARASRFFPNLTHLTWIVSFSDHHNYEPFLVPNVMLRQITVIYGSGWQLQNAVKEVLEALRNGWLLGLREVVVQQCKGNQYRVEDLPYEEYESFGVMLRIKEMTRIRLTKKLAIVN